MATKSIALLHALLLVVVLLLPESQTASSRRKIHAQDRKGQGCPPPDVEVIVNGSYVDDSDVHDTQYNDVVEVKFSAEIGPMGEMRLCKIKCIGGEWHGPLCQQDDGGGRFHPLLRGCRLDALSPHLIVTYKNTTVTAETILTYPHGSVVSSRCRELGVYKLLGVATSTCLNGVWSNRIPACIPTTVLTNFTEDSPPTILFRVPSGSASVEPTGELAVFPGSILHLECLFSRKMGNPEWTWTPTFRQYLTGWAIAAEERDWKYRLSVYYTKIQDSGVYSCSTPRGITNSINVRVTAVHCTPIESNDPYLTSRVEGSRLGQEAMFHCPLGFRLLGAANLTCQASGRWSAPLPRCELIVCPTLESLDPHLNLLEQNTSYRGRAVFRCLWGYQMIGQPGIECELSGRWSAQMPVCKAVECPPPLAPINGRIVEDGRAFKVGAVVQYVCDDRHQLVGDPSVVCTDAGYWSHPPPFCKARCAYPGDPPNGRIAPVKFSYEPGDHLKVTCSAGFEVRLEARPTCRPDGLWSEPLPECKNYVDI